MATPVEFQRASGPVPSTVPPVAEYTYVKGSLSGSLAFTCTATLSPEPAKMEDGLTEHAATGG